MKINVTQSSMPPYEEYCQEIKELWDSHWLTNMGVKHQQFQKQLEDYLDVPHVTLYTNGHLALENAISIFQFPKESEIITTPFTFASTTHAIVRNNCIPVFCDIKLTDYTIDENKIEELITDKTAAILPVHVYGNICNTEAIQSIADKHNLKVIYDAAHAFGETYKGIPIANFGDISMFSFHATKVFNTIEGGALTYNKDTFVQPLNDNKNFGIRDEENVAFVGGNAKMNEFQAAMGICNLRYVKKEIEKRKNVAETYLKLLKNTDGITLPTYNHNTTYNYSYFPILCKDETPPRDHLYNMLSDQNIISRKYFYPATNNFSCYNMFNKKNTPIAKLCSENVLCLPIYADLNISTINSICNIIYNYQ